MNELGAEVLPRAEDRLEHRTNVLTAESVDVDLEQGTSALEVGDEARQARSGLFTAVRERDQYRLGRVAASEVKDQLQGRVVAPMDVLDGEDWMLRAREERYDL